VIIVKNVKVKKFIGV